MIQENKLSKRIKYLIEICPQCNVYADIGCDHGYVALNLVEQNRAKFVYCVDIHKKSLEKAKTLFEQNNKFNLAKFCCGDGFVELSEQEKQEIDCSVIAGMGGNEIINIISQHKTNKLVLQPMHNQKQLREFLLDNGYNIFLDTVLYEKNKFYTFLVCEKNEKLTNYSSFELEFGKKSKSLDYINYLKSQEQKYLNIFNKTKNNSILNILQNIQNVLKYGIEVEDL